MKKIFLLSLFAIAFTPVFAQTTATSGSDNSKAKMVDVQVDAAALADPTAQLASIDISFCDSTSKQINLEALPNEQVPLCIQATNNSDKPVSVTVKFVDGVFTNDQWKNRACQTDDKTSLFGQYVTGYENIMVLAPHSVVKKSPVFQYSQSKTGMILGCIVYAIKDIANATNGPVNFNIQIRKAKFIDMDIVTQKKAEREAALLAESRRSEINTYVYILLAALALILVAAKLVIGKKPVAEVKKPAAKKQAPAKKHTKK